MFGKDAYSVPITKERIKKSIFMTIPTGIYAIIYIIWFNYLEKRNVVHFTEMHTWLDDKIPFLEIFVLPYIFWFGFVLFCVLFPVVKYEREDYWRFVIFICTGMTVFLVISTLFPTIQHLRPAEMPRDNIFTDMVSFFYTHDTPTNVFPSMHAYNAIGAAISLCYSRRVSKGGRIFGMVSATLITLSTVFIKQHSVIDVTAAIGLSIVIYYIIYRTDFVMNILRRLGLIDPLPEHEPQEGVFVK